LEVALKKGLVSGDDEVVVAAQQEQLRHRRL
jgi:hypothetical protein